MKRSQEYKTNKIFVIGLDGGTFTVLRPLIDSGKLPILAAMMEGGAWGELASTIPPHTAPAWASFITGKNPGKHGIFQFSCVDRSLYEGGGARIVNSKTISGQTLWDIIGREKKKVGMINVPLTYPPYPVNGFMVTGMLTPRGADQFTYPADLAASLENYKIDVSLKEGDYGGLEDLNTEDPEVLVGLIEELNALVDMRTEVATRLIKIYQPDFFMILFTETDRIQHIFWPYLQPDHLQSESVIEEKLQGAIENFFRQLDHNLAKLIAIAGDDTVKIIMSDHGFGPVTRKDVNFNVWLRDRGLLKLQKGPRSVLNPKRWLRRMGLSKEVVYSAMSFLFPGHMVRRLEKTWGRVVSSPIDWSGTKAVFIPIFEFVGGIQIFSQDSTFQWKDSHSKEYEDLRNGLIRELLELRDPQTNEPIVLEAYRREDIYAGEHTHRAPDIVFVMSPNYRGDKSILSKHLVSEKLKRVTLWTGTHRKEGMVVFNGPNISAGRISRFPQIQDLTPTILYLLGIAIPEDMDGKVIEEAIEASCLDRNKVKYTRSMPPIKEESRTEMEELSEEEMEQVRKHLESLGYLS